MKVVVMFFLGLFMAAAFACDDYVCPEPPSTVSQESKEDLPLKKVEPTEEGPTVIYDGTGEPSALMKSKLASYLGARNASVADISEDGKNVLMNTRFGETLQVHIVKEPLGARTQLTFLDETVSNPSFVPGHTDQITYVSDKGGNEQYRLYYADLAHNETTAVSQEGARVQYYLWSNNGKMLAFNSNARNGKDMDIYICDGQDASTVKKVGDGKGHWMPIGWSSDDKKILVLEYISIEYSKLHLIDLEKGETREITPPEEKSSFRDAVFGKDSNSIFVATDRGAEFVQLSKLNLENGEWANLSKEISWNVEGLALSFDGSTLAFTVNEDGYGRLYLYDTEKESYARVDTVADGVIKDMRFARKTNRLVFSVNSPVAARDIYTLDLGGDAPIRWTEMEIGGLNADNFVSPTLVHYKTFDDKKIPAFYFKPKGEGPFPVVVKIHGGPEAQSRPVFLPYLQFLVNELGIAVLVPNVRGSDGYGKTYVGLDNGFLREDSVKDIGALLDWIGENKELDAKNVGVLGGSYGGYMVLASLMHYSDRIKAGVEIVGISSFITFLENTKEYRRDLRRAEYGDERDPKMREHFEKIDPVKNVEKIKSALFVAHGANDPRVPVGEAEQIVKAVRESGRDVWYMLAKNEGHGFRRRENRDAYYLLMLTFFEKHLTR